MRLLCEGWTRERSVDAMLSSLASVDKLDSGFFCVGVGFLVAEIQRAPLLTCAAFGREPWRSFVVRDLGAAARF
jgi:hypothetical protein